MVFAWSNISSVVEDSVSLADFSSLMEIAYMRFDTEENKFVDFVQFTSNNSLDMIPYVAESNGLPYVVWINDEGGNILGNSNKIKLISAAYNGAGWSETILQENLTNITSLVALNTSENEELRLESVLCTRTCLSEERRSHPEPMRGRRGLRRGSQK